MSHFAATGTGPGTYYCSDGVPVELGLLTILAAFGVAFGILYRSLTIKTGRRRRRSEEGSDGWEGEGCKDLESNEELLRCKFHHLLGRGSGLLRFADLLWHGESFTQFFLQELGPAAKIDISVMACIFFLHIF